LQYFPDEAREELRQRCERARNGECSFDERTFRSAGGARLWFELSFAPAALGPSDGILLGLLEIGERMRAMAVTRDQTEKLSRRLACARALARLGEMALITE